MIETCTDCGRTWGVIMAPRKVVRCTDCSRPRPWRFPDRYWNFRAWSDTWPPAVYRSPEWWDQQCALQDLRYVARAPWAGF